MHGASCIGAVLEHLKAEDVQVLLANRGLPAVGDKVELADRLQVRSTQFMQVLTETPAKSAEHVPPLSEIMYTIG